MKLINLKNEELIFDKDTNEPIIIIYDLKKESNSKLKIRVKKDIKASIIELFTGSETISEYTREFIVEENATLEYLKYQDLEKESVLDCSYNINLLDNATLNMFNLELGLGSNKNSYNSNLDNENAKLNIFGLVKIYENSDSKSIFETIHNRPNIFSNVSYKHILNDKSKATFSCKTVVNEKAIHSKVIQNSNTLLLSDDATILAQPHMEINIDELEASHGATTGSLDQEQLLYLQSRGIDKEKAEIMLLKAFENEIYDNIQDLKVKNFISNYKRSDYV